MPWKKIVKVASAVVIGGGIASGTPAEAIQLPPEMVHNINALLGALAALIMMFVRSPKDD